MKNNRVLFRVVALLLSFVLLIPCTGGVLTAQAAEARASYYLSSYNSYVCAMGGGNLEIWFSVTAVNYMDDIGTLSIKLYESTDKITWTRVKTFLHEDYSSMLAQNDIIHSSYVSYQGSPGRYYKAYVCIWAGKDGGGDSRYMWTTIEKAT